MRLSKSEIQKVDVIVSKLIIISNQLTNIYKTSDHPILKRTSFSLREIVDKLDYELSQQ